MTRRVSVTVVVSTLLVGSAMSAQAPAKPRAERVEALRTRAVSGDAGAQNQLGSMYAAGTGVPKDLAQAVEWYRKAADQGLAEAQYNLGLSYADGTGVTADDVDAYKWLALAVLRGAGPHQMDAANQRDLLVQEMTPARLAEAEQRVRSWLEEFDRQGKK